MEKVQKRVSKMEKVEKGGKFSLWFLASEVCTILNALYEVDVARKRVKLRNLRELIGRGEDVS